MDSCNSHSWPLFVNPRDLTLEPSAPSVLGSGRFSYEITEFQGLEAFPNPNMAFIGSPLFQPQPEPETAVSIEDLASGAPSLQVGQGDNETYMIDHAPLIPSRSNPTFTARSRNSASVSRLCPKCDKSFLHRFEYK